MLFGQTLKEKYNHLDQKSRSPSNFLRTVRFKVNWIIKASYHNTSFLSLSLHLFSETLSPYYHSLRIYTLYNSCILLRLGDYHSAQFHHVEFRLSFYLKNVFYCNFKYHFCSTLFSFFRDSNYSHDGSSLPFFHFNHFPSDPL